jgi:hypothetical protein
VYGVKIEVCFYKLLVVEANVTYSAVIEPRVVVNTVHVHVEIELGVELTSTFLTDKLLI